jgi:hypothetical protein
LGGEEKEMTYTKQKTCVECGLKVDLFIESPKVYAVGSGVIVKCPRCHALLGFQPGVVVEMREVQE